MKAEEFYKKHIELGFFECMDQYASTKAKEVAIEFARYIDKIQFDDTSSEHNDFFTQWIKDKFKKWYAQYKNK